MDHRTNGRRRKSQPPCRNPRCFPNVLDTCTLHNQEDSVIDDIIALSNREPDDGKISLLLPHSVIREIAHTNTPNYVKNRANQLIYTTEVSLTQSEQNIIDDITRELQGNALSEKHANDALHLFEAIKYGTRYFITYDKRIISKAPEIRHLKGMRIVIPKEFLEIYRSLES